MDKMSKSFFVFVAIAFIALLFAYFALNSALRSPRQDEGDDAQPQNSIPGSFLSSPSAYFCP